MKPATTIVQRIARSIFVTACAAIFTGVAAAETVRVVNHKPAATPAITMPDAKVVSLEAVELLKPISSEAPAKSESSKPTQLASSHRTRTIWMEVTAYCPCEKCCGEGAHGVTASGKRISYNRSRFVAADTDLLPFGTKLKIPGYYNGRSVEVIDRGGAIEGRRLDVFFPTHQQALEWGRRMVKVAVVE